MYLSHHRPVANTIDASSLLAVLGAGSHFRVHPWSCKGISLSALLTCQNATHLLNLLPSPDSQESDTETCCHANREIQFMNFHNWAFLFYVLLLWSIGPKTLGMLGTKPSLSPAGPFSNEGPLNLGTLSTDRRVSLGKKEKRIPYSL